MELTRHYEQLLGLGESWTVKSVNLDLVKARVDVYLEYTDGAAPCPICGKHSILYDKAAEREWRHLDVMQFLTVIHARTPRCKCVEHGVKMIDLPWAEKHSRFTLMFEAFAVKVLEMSNNIKSATQILKLNWEQTQTIMTRAVERGMSARLPEEISAVGIDEKSFKKRKPTPEEEAAGKKDERFVSVIVDHDNGRLLDVVLGRSEESGTALIDKALQPWQQFLVGAVSMDMSAPFSNAVSKRLVNAETVYDKFHVTKHFNEAIDEVRRREYKELSRHHDERLKNTRWVWLTGLEHLSPAYQKSLDELLKCELKTGKAWGYKQSFNAIYERRSIDFAREYFNRWYDSAMKSGLAPIKKVARMIKRHLEGILNWYKWHIANGIVEGFNSKIQSIKAAARGFRNFENYRTAILFRCGKLNLEPIVSVFLPSGRW